MLTFAALPHRQPPRLNVRCDHTCHRNSGSARPSAPVALPPSSDLMFHRDRVRIRARSGMPELRDPAARGSTQTGCPAVRSSMVISRRNLPRADSPGAFASKNHTGSPTSRTRCGHGRAALHVMARRRLFPATSLLGLGSAGKMLHHYGGLLHPPTFCAATMVSRFHMTLSSCTGRNLRCGHASAPLRSDLPGHLLDLEDHEFGGLSGANRRSRSRRRY